MTCIVYMPKGQSLESYLCSLGPVEPYSEQDSWAGKLSDTLNLTNIVNRLSRPESETECLMTLPSSETLESSTKEVMRNPMLVTSMSSAQDSRSCANHLVTPEKEPEPQMSAICGRQPESAYTLYDPATSSWKTCPVLLAQDTLERFSLTYFKSGMTQDGVIYRLPNWEHRISGNVYSSLPAPTASEDVSGRRLGGAEEVYTDKTGKPRRRMSSGATASMGLGKMAATNTWPTPRANSAMAATITQDAIDKSWDRFPNLETVVARQMFPTPKARQRGDVPSERRRRSPSLEAMVNVIPTPQSRDWKGSSGRSAKGLELDLPTFVGGHLNPDWVEWLMGWPRGWTSLEPMPIARFREWQMRMRAGRWWTTEPDIPRVTKPTKDRVSRLKALGNGVVPAVMAKAWRILTLQEEV